MSQDHQQNKANAIAYYKMAYEGHPAEAVKLYAGNDYKQHNPQVADGKAGFIAYFDRMARDFPDKTIRFVRAVAEDNLVVLHTHQVWPATDKKSMEEYVTMDFFKFDSHGKIIEHWDAIQQIPDTSANGNTMY